MYFPIKNLGINIFKLISIFFVQIQLSYISFIIPQIYISYVPIILYQQLYSFCTLYNKCITY